MVWGEILLTVYAVLTVLVALERGQVQVVPFLLLYVFGFAYVSVVGLVHPVKRRDRVRRARRREREPAARREGSRADHTVSGET
jgi:hypothetical protein